MQKKWMVAGAAVLMVAGAMPWAVGYVTQQQWQQAAQQVNLSQPFVQVETGDYQRGILGSTVSGALMIRQPEAGVPHRIGYRVSISHGITGSLLEFEPDGGWKTETVDWFENEQPRLTVETRLWGTATAEFEAPAMTITDTNSNSSLVASGGLARVEIENAGARANVLLVWPALSLATADLDVRMTDLHLEQTMEHLVDDVWTGEGELDVASLLISPGADAPTEFRDFSVTTSTGVDDDGQRLNYRIDAALEELAVAGGDYGPHRLVLLFDNLEVASWSRLTSGMSDLQTLSLHSGAADHASMAQAMKAMEQINTALRELASAGFSLAIPELSLTTPEGKVLGDAEIRHPELPADQRAAMLMVMQRLAGEMNLSLPLALAENYPALQLQLAPLIKQGLLVQKADRLVMQATMQDLMVDVNGVEIPLPPLM